MQAHGRAAFTLLIAGIAFAQQQAGKELLPGEFDSYNEIVKDVNSRNFSKALTDIDAWRQKFPASAYKDNGAALEIQAFAETNQAAKALDSMGALMSRGLDTVYPGDAGQPTVIRLLYAATWAISHVQNPTAQEITTGESAAKQLMSYDKQLPGVSPAQWEQARADMKAKASAALFYLAMLPGTQAMAKHPPDCAAAEAAYAGAIGAYPDKSLASYELGRALNCQVKEQPDKVFAAIYEFERAAVIDPKLGDPAADPTKVTMFADHAYVQLHGSDEGLQELKQRVKESALPPAGFRFATAAEIAEQKRAEFEKNNPQVAMWLRIKAALAGDGGSAFFENQMKDSSVPKLKGTLVEAKPACRPRELLVAVPAEADTKPAGAEIRLKLERPLAGKPAVGDEFEWEGIATAFTPQPFLLTLDTEPAKISGLKLENCAAPARKK